MSITTTGNSAIRNGDLTLRTIKPQDNANTIINFNAMTTVERLAYPFTGPTITYDITLAQWFLNASAGVFEQINGASIPTGPAGGVLTGTYPNPGLAANSVVNGNIQANQVTFSKMQQISNNTLIGNSIGTVANPSTIGITGALNFSGPNLTVRSATTSLDGSVILATNGGTTANTVVQANDSRLLAITSFNGNTATPVMQVFNNDSFVSTSSTVETSLKTCTLVSNTFQVNGDNIEGYFSGSFDLTAVGSITIRIYVANVLVSDSVISYSTTGSWQANIKVMRFSTLGLSCNSLIVSDVITPGIPSTSDVGNVNITTTLTNPVSIQLRAFVSNTSTSFTCSNGVINGAKNV